MLIKSGLVFLPKQFFTAAFLKTPTPKSVAVCPAMRIAIWVCTLDLEFQELGVLCLVYCLWLFLWWTNLYNERRWATATCETECVAPPS